MKTNTTLGIILLLFLMAGGTFQLSAQSPSWQWAKRVGSFNDNAPFSTGDQNERFNDIKVDPSGNVYAVGEFFQNPAFDNQSTAFPTTGGYGERDAYLIKFNKCGETLWWRRMGGTNRDAAKSLVLDTSGHVVVLAGSGSSTYTVGDGNHDTTITSINIVFLAKFDTAGNFVNVLNTYMGFPNFFSPNVTTRLFIDSQSNYFISDGMQAARVNTSGAATNFYNYTATSGNVPNIRGVTIDKNDNVYASGFFTGTVVIGGTTVTYTNVPPGQGNSLIYKFSPAGSLSWINTSNPIGGGGDVLGKCTVDTSGTLLLTAGVASVGSTVFGYSVTPPIQTANANVFYRFSASSGSLISAMAASMQYIDFIAPSYTSKDNGIYCSGTIAGYLAFNTGSYTSNPSSSGRQSCVGRYDLISNTVSINMLPQSGSSAASVREAVHGMNMDSQGNLYVCGMFGGTLDSLGTAVNIIGGSEDGFIAKFGYPCGSVPSGSVPNVPLSLAAVNASLTNNVTWTDNSNDETGFELHYTISPSSTYSLLATLPANTTSYPHTGLSYSTTYCYKVAATNSVGMSAFSNSACATTPVSGATTGISQPMSQASLFHYPNPASEVLYFHLPANEVQAEVSIFNALGTLVLTQKKYISTNAIDISALDNGLYYYKITLTTGEFAGKVIKN